jgi:hypothetical protein
MSDLLLHPPAIGPNFWRPAVIGDFTEAEACRFLQWELDRTAGKGIVVYDRQWAEIFKVWMHFFMNPLDPHFL